jgi:hypothetical protein
MYAPYTPQLVFCILHLIGFSVATVLHSCILVKAIRIVLNILMTLVVILDICLLFSISMGVGASGYDSNAKNCYLLL